MNLSDWGSIACILSFVLAALLALIDRWPQMTPKGGPMLPKIALGFLIMGIISAGFVVFASWYGHSRLTFINQGITSHIQEKTGPSKEEVELLVKKLVQDHMKEVRKEASREKFVLPPLGEKAVLKLEPLERPEPEQFTLDELKAIPISAQGKILRNQIGWLGYADIADAAVKAHEDYERSIFGGEKAK